MTMLKWITKDTNIDFMKARFFTYALSIVLVVLSFLSIYYKGFNFGIDFSGGVLMEIKSEKPINVEEIRSKLSVLNLDELNLQTIGETGNELMIRAQADNANEEVQRKSIVDIKKILGSEYEYRRVDSVGPQVGDELKTAGIVASVLAMIAIAIYIWVRFEWQFALGALVGLFHDIIVTVGLLSYFRFDFSLTTVAAILTLVGYSINDTVVTYDRIRENLKKYRKMPQLELLNKSINDIFSRTILTGVTTLFAVVPLYLCGGEALESFSFTIFAGLIIGTYSSIYVCTAFLNLFDLRAVNHKDEDNIFATIG
ncbi:MAG: protein translocase subunit SecF [Alphaproteobacteria bacterium]|nr:protein translocase subunit SecF [Alphaproteobacteria bacterium]